VQHSTSVIDDLDELAASGFNVDANAMGTGVERILQQLLDHRSWALDYLAGGDFVGDIFGEDVDATHQILRYMKSSGWWLVARNSRPFDSSLRSSLRMTPEQVGVYEILGHYALA
jgi:hypothetical protein